MSEIADDSDDDTSDLETPRSSSPDITIEIGPCSATCTCCDSPHTLFPRIPVARFLLLTHHLMARNTRKRTAAAVDAEAAISAPESQPPAAPPQQASPAPPAETVDDAQAEPALATRPSKKARLSTKEQIAMLARELEETRGMSLLCIFVSFYLGTKFGLTPTHLYPSSLPQSCRGVHPQVPQVQVYVCQGEDPARRPTYPSSGWRAWQERWTLRKALQLEGNTDMYLTILASV